MSKKSLPPPTIWVLDEDPAMRKRLGTFLPEALSEYGGCLYEGIPDPKVRLFASADKAMEVFKNPAKLRSVMEPCLLITDQIGTVPLHNSVAKRVRGKYPWMKTLLHSGGIDREKVHELHFEHNFIDDYVKKGRFEKLGQRVAHWYRTYWEQSPLRTMREYIAISRDPTEKFFPGRGNTWLTMIDVYWEVVRDTEFGRELREAWDRLMAAQMTARD